MKQIVIKSLVMVVSIGLVVSCSSTNTQGENTTIGAATGAVIGGVAGSAFGAGTGQIVAAGVGAVAGALIGGYVGQSMDHSDNKQATRVMENNPAQKSSHWKNKKTGAEYTMTPTSGHMAMNGQANCRTYHTTAIINGKTTEIDGTACRQSNGSWKAVNHA